MHFIKNNKLCKYMSSETISVLIIIIHVQYARGLLSIYNIEKKYL